MEAKARDSIRTHNVRTRIREKIIKKKRKPIAKVGRQSAITAGDLYAEWKVGQCALNGVPASCSYRTQNEATRTRTRAQRKEPAMDTRTGSYYQSANNELLAACPVCRRMQCSGRFRIDFSSHLVESDNRVLYFEHFLGQTWCILFCSGWPYAFKIPPHQSAKESYRTYIHTTSHLISSLAFYDLTLKVLEVRYCVGSNFRREAGAQLRLLAKFLEEIERKIRSSVTGREYKFLNNKVVHFVVLFDSAFFRLECSNLVVRTMFFSHKKCPLEHLHHSCAHKSKQETIPCP